MQARSHSHQHPTQRIAAPAQTKTSPARKKDESAVDQVKKLTGKNDWKGMVGDLNSKGDTAHGRKSVDGQVDTPAKNLIPWGRAAKAAGASKASQAVKQKGAPISGTLDVTAKVQTGHAVTVTRDSNASNSTYTVRYTKSTAGGLGLEAMGKYGPAAPPQFVQRLHPAMAATKGAAALFLREDFPASVQTTVELKVNSKEEAVRAAETFDKLAAADMVDDAARTAPFLLGGRLAWLPARPRTRPWAWKAPTPWPMR